MTVVSRGSGSSRHTDQPAVVTDALDRVPVYLELADDSSWEVNAARAKLTKGHRLFGLAQALEQPPRLFEPEADLRRDWAKMQKWPMTRYFC